MENLPEIINTVLGFMSGQGGLLAQIASIVLMIVGYLMVANAAVKSIENAALAFVKVTSTLKDDKFVNKVLNSSLYKTIKKVLGMSLNIKLPESNS